MLCLFVFETKKSQFSLINMSMLHKNSTQSKHIEQLTRGDHTNASQDLKR